MTAPRIGGRAFLPTGERLTWTVAGGARGTRWREATDVDGRLIRSLLLEVAPTGRSTRLELTTSEGLLTLHPEPDESAIHGNVVGPAGVRHLALPWSPDDELWVVGSPATTASSLARLASTVPVGEGMTVRSLRIDDGLMPRRVERRIERRGDRTWHLAIPAPGVGDPDDEPVDIEIDDRGHVVHADSSSWPLEI